MIEEKIKNRLINEWLSEDEKRYLDEAIERCEKDNPGILSRQITNHKKSLDKKILFGPLDEMIKFLVSLKAEGYVSVSEEWSGYETNYFVANKYEDETNEEYLSRVWDIIQEELISIKDKIEEEENIRKEIAELKARLLRL